MSKIHGSGDVQGIEALQCGQCDYTTTRIDSLQTHNLTKHEGIKHQCDKCSSSFTRERDLKRHILSIHLEDQPDD